VMCETLRRCCRELTGHLALSLVHESSPTDFSTLSLHDALPISPGSGLEDHREADLLGELFGLGRILEHAGRAGQQRQPRRAQGRSEEHTSELQSPYDLVCRLQLEKKKYTEHPAQRTSC